MLETARSILALTRTPRISDWMNTLWNYFAREMLTYLENNKGRVMRITIYKLFQNGNNQELKELEFEFSWQGYFL